MQGFRLGMIAAFAALGAVTAFADGAASHGMDAREAAGPPPTLTLEALPDADWGHALHLVTANFRFSPENVGTATETVEGHAHLYIDGVKLARLYGDWFHLPGNWLSEGEHVVSVALYDNVHRRWTAGGESVAAGLILSGANSFDGLLIERTLGDGDAETVTAPVGRTVRLVLHVLAPTELHLHGYDMTATARPGGPAAFEFKAQHAGRFAVVKHGAEGILGGRERAVIYLEVHP